MASGLQKKVRLPKNRHKLNSSLTNSQAVKGSCIILDTIFHIYKLKLKLEAIKREYHQLKSIQEVKVEKFGENFQVNIACKKGQNVLVSILETLEEMGLNVTQANFSCKGCFLIIKAILRGRDQEDINVQCIEQALHKAIDKQVDYD